VLAIRSLQQRASAEVVDYFSIEEDGSFTVDTMLITALPRPVSGRPMSAQARNCAAIHPD